MQPSIHMIDIREDHLHGEERRVIPLTWFRLAILLLMVALPLLAKPHPSLAQTLDLLFLRPPTPVAAEGSIHIVYEVVVDNPGDQPLLVSRLEVFDGDETRDLPLAAYAGRALRDLTFFDTQRIEAGSFSILYLWIVVDSTEVPTTLRHRLTILSDGERVHEEELLVPIAPDEPVVIGPPLRGENWLTVGNANHSGHRRTVKPFDGTGRVAQRFAIDWAQIGPDGETFAGDPLQNESYHAYGVEVLAVADGVVTAIHDGAYAPG